MHASVYLDGESNGDIFGSVRRTGLPDFTLQGCQITKFTIFWHIKTEERARNLYTYDFQTEN